MIFNSEMVIEIHQRMIEMTGGIHGIKDYGLLDSAVQTIYQTFNGKDLYPTLIHKACRLCYGLNRNHAFVDGNKRISMHMLALFLRIHDVDYRPSNHEVIRVGLELASNQLSYEDLICWVNQNIK
jgi:death on curing protein